MAVVVQKYGGSSVADVERIRRVAARIVAAKEAGNDVVAVVSAMAGTTNDLLALAKSVSPDPRGRELDMLVSVGERISMALLSMAIHELGHDAVSFTGSQSGIITDVSHGRARVVEVRPFRIQDEVAAGKIVIVAGFQGVSYRREITTLGRGGSDTTAICLAAALDAEYCEICSDVDGVYTSDPRVVPSARRIDAMTHDEMLELARSGAKVLNAEAVEYARRHGVAIYARSTFGGPSETGTVVRKDLATSHPEVTAVTAKKDILVLELHSETPQAAVGDIAALLDAIGERESGPMRVAMEGAGPTRTELWFRLENTPSPESLAQRLSAAAPTVRIQWPTAAVTIVGPDLASNPRILATVLAVLRRMGVSAQGMHGTAAALSIRVVPEQADDAVRALHDALIDAW